MNHCQCSPAAGWAAPKAPSDPDVSSEGVRPSTVTSHRASTTSGVPSTSTQSCDSASALSRPPPEKTTTLVASPSGAVQDGP